MVVATLEVLLDAAGAGGVITGVQAASFDLQSRQRSALSRQRKKDGDGLSGSWYTPVGEEQREEPER